MRVYACMHTYIYRVLNIQTYIHTYIRKYQTKRDQGHRAGIKQGKKSNSCLMHLIKNKNHQINWKTTKILDKAKDYHRKIFKASLGIYAFRNEKLMSLEVEKPTISIWKQSNAEIRRFSNF